MGEGAVLAGRASVLFPDGLDSMHVLHPPYLTPPRPLVRSSRTPRELFVRRECSTFGDQVVSRLTTTVEQAQHGRTPRPSVEGGTHRVTKSPDSGSLQTIAVDRAGLTEVTRT